MSAPVDARDRVLPEVAPDWADEVRELCREQSAVILAHNYTTAEIQSVADQVGDSLALARWAAASDAETIVLAGVAFMAETAKILAPDRKVLLPDRRAGCSLADSITADQLRTWKADHPGAVVVAYVNTTAEVKAEADLCCTSANAVEIVESVPAETDVLFLPDQFLGAHVRRVTQRENLHVWMGECHVHAGISGEQLRRKVAESPDADVLVHPECGCATSALWMAGTGDLPSERTKILSTSGMLEYATKRPSSHVLVATEVGMLNQLRQASPETSFEPVNPKASCGYMKLTTPQALLNCLRNGVHEIEIEPDTLIAARRSVAAMLGYGTPSRIGE